MRIPKGKSISWNGVTYREGDQVHPSHIDKVREILGLSIESEETPRVELICDALDEEEESA